MSILRLGKLSKFDLLYIILFNYIYMKYYILAYVRFGFLPLIYCGNNNN